MTGRRAIARKRVPHAAYLVIQARFVRKERFEVQGSKFQKPRPSHLEPSAVSPFSVLLSLRTQNSELLHPSRLLRTFCCLAHSSQAPHHGRASESNRIPLQSKLIQLRYCRTSPLPLDFPSISRKPEDFEENHKGLFKVGSRNRWHIDCDIPRQGGSGENSSIPGRRER